MSYRSQSDLYLEDNISKYPAIELLCKMVYTYISPEDCIAQRDSHFGVLFPGAAIHTNGSPSQFLIWFQNVFPKPDIVFTDIQLGAANGYYVAHKLRENGYTGGIIALTSYGETEENARQLKAAGFDGMVSLDERYWKVPFAQRVTQAAQVYLERNATK